jgi:hypothetical protein
VKAVDNQGKQPMHWAAEYGELKVLKVHLADPRIVGLKHWKMTRQGQE